MRILQTANASGSSCLRLKGKRHERMSANDTSESRSDSTNGSTPDWRGLKDSFQIEQLLHARSKYLPYGVSCGGGVRQKLSAAHPAHLHPVIPILILLCKFTSVFHTQRTPDSRPPPAAHHGQHTDPDPRNPGNPETSKHLRNIIWGNMPKKTSKV